MHYLSLFSSARPHYLGIVSDSDPGSGLHIQHTSASHFITLRYDLACPSTAEASRLLSFHDLFLDTSFSQALTNGRVVC